LSHYYFLIKVQNYIWTVFAVWWRQKYFFKYQKIYFNLSVSLEYINNISFFKWVGTKLMIHNLYTLTLYSFFLLFTQCQALWQKNWYKYFKILGMFVWIDKVGLFLVVLFDLCKLNISNGSKYSVSINY